MLRHQYSAITPFQISVAASRWSRLATIASRAPGENRGGGGSSARQRPGSRRRMAERIGGYLDHVSINVKGLLSVNIMRNIQNSDT